HRPVQAVLVLRRGHQHQRQAREVHAGIPRAAEAPRRRRRGARHHGVIAAMPSLRGVAAGTLRGRHPLGAALVLALFTASQALLWYAYYGNGAKLLIGDELHYQQTALAILAGGPWMESAIWPPLQPLLLAALYLPFGAHVLVAQLA